MVNVPKFPQSGSGNGVTANGDMEEQLFRCRGEDPSGRRRRARSPPGWLFSLSSVLPRRRGASAREDSAAGTDGPDDVNVTRASTPARRATTPAMPREASPRPRAKSDPIRQSLPTVNHGSGLHGIRSSFTATDVVSSDIQRSARWSGRDKSPPPPERDPSPLPRRSASPNPAADSSHRRAERSPGPTEKKANALDDSCTLSARRQTGVAHGFSRVKAGDTHCGGSPDPSRRQAAGRLTVPGGLPVGVGGPVLPTPEECANPLASMDVLVRRRRRLRELQKQMNEQESCSDSQFVAQKVMFHGGPPDVRTVLPLEPLIRIRECVIRRDVLAIYHFVTVFMSAMSAKTVEDGEISLSDVYSLAFIALRLRCLGPFQFLFDYHPRYSITLAVVSKSAVQLSLSHAPGTVTVNAKLDNEENPLYGFLEDLHECFDPQPHLFRHLPLPLPVEMQLPLKPILKNFEQV